MPRQLTFDLPGKPALGREDFFISPSNALAVSVLTQDWPDGRCLLIGPDGSGKTHLSHVWAAETGARIIPATGLSNELNRIVTHVSGHYVIEDIDKVAGKAADEETLFHLLNAARGSGTRLLLTSEISPSQAGFTLADLKSRLQGTMSAGLMPPDDVLLSAILVKLFRDRQVDVAPELVQYLVERADRSFSGMQAMVEKLDKAALAEGRAITRRLAMRVLDNMG